MTARAIAGEITRLAATAAEATLAEGVARYSTVKILFLTPAVSAQSAAYAQVMALHAGDEAATATRVALHFTSLPEDAKVFLERQHAAACQAEPSQR